MKKCAIVSFRLGGVDGVSKVSALWQEMLENLGFDVYTVAGAGTADYILPGLAIGASAPPTHLELAEVFDPADLVVVENLCTIPLNLPAAKIVAEVLDNKPTIMHHHDPPWQRKEFQDITDLPIQNPNWHNIVINQITKEQMTERGISAVCIYNPFKIESPPASFPLTTNREKTRDQLGVQANELLIAHPVRAIPRKNISTAIDITQELGGTYWITGSTEPFDDYENEFKTLLKNANCRTIWEPIDSATDIYSAADLIVFPSLWESFGLPPVEASIYGRFAVVGDYPVADELIALGFKWFRANELDELKEILKDPDSPENEKLLRHNREVAEQHLSLEVIQSQLEKVVSSV